ncbi:MAG: hypothetical protein ACXVPD_00750, partial [Bacteroidia bacterium]
YSAANLNVQPLGGSVTFHCDTSITATSQAILTETAALGLGLTAPVEKLDVNGAIHLGTTTNSNPGTIRYTGTDFEGYIGSAWKSLTAGNGPWSHGTGKTIYYFDTNTSRIAVGSTDASATLDIRDTEAVNTGNIAVSINNQSTTTSSVLDSHKVGERIVSNGTWGGLPQTKNIGLYISDVSGHTPVEANIAAVMNGNVLVGDLISGQQSFGTDAAHVLSIQAGTAPGSSPDTSAIQIYSANQSGSTTAIFNVRMGNGDVVKLFKGTKLPARDTDPIGDTYTSVEAGVLSNLRDRLNAMEDLFKAFGFIG